MRSEAFILFSKNLRRLAELLSRQTRGRNTKDLRDRTRNPGPPSLDTDHENAFAAGQE